MCKKYILSVFLILGSLSGIVSAQQTTDTLLMVSPNNFKFNKETAKNNLFQKDLEISNDIALQEFNSMVTKLKNNNIRVIIMPSKQNVETPDSIFPNNWFSIHSTKKPNEKILIIYPMFTKNRRLELQSDKLISLLEKEGVTINKTIDFSPYANKLMFLEGTGSLVLDRENHIAYAAISPRTNIKMVNIFAKKMNYKPVIFHSADENNQLIYHTNVMMSVGSDFAVVALDSISNKKEREMLLKQLDETNKEIISISLEQVKNMTGNILEVRATDGKTKIIMSESAYNSFTPEQLNILRRYGDLISVNIKNIEMVGGGSARCMLAEVF